MSERVLRTGMFSFTPNNMPRIGDERGFSLLELIVVLTMLSIITASVVPVFAGALGSVRNDSHVRDIVSNIRYASERSVADSLKYRLYFDPQEGTYWLARKSIDPESDTEFEDVIENGTARQLLPDGLQFMKSKARVDADKIYFIGFYPNGSADYGDIVVKDEKRDTVVHIETGGYLGRVVVTERKR